MADLARPGVGQLWAGRPVHGGTRPELLRSGVVDFSVSINPYAPPRGLRAAVLAVDLRPYPDPWASRLAGLIAAAHHLEPDQVLVGNGATELIFIIARALLGPGHRTLVVGPAFGEYAYASALSGSQVSVYHAPAETGFVPDLEELLELAARLRPSLTWVANPGNPTGVYLPQHFFEALLEAGPGVLVIDESFRSFVESPWASEPLMATGRVLLLRSLTKDFGLAGLRLGYLLGPAALTRRIWAHQPPWAVSSLAQAAGEFIFSRASEFTEMCRVKIGRRRRELRRALEGLGFWVSESAANFLLVRTGDGAACAQFLLESHGIAVRDCTSFGLPQYIRVAVLRRSENRRLVAGLAAWAEFRSGPRPVHLGRQPGPASLGPGLV
ncbi:MAG: aminotransferase class I/II [Chloroflexota bacterium]